MAKYEFEVRSFHPPEYRSRFYSIFDEERSKGNLTCRYGIEETAPPPELVKDIILVTASSLTIIKILYDFHKEIRNKKGRVVIRIRGKDYDLEAYDIEELKLKISNKEKEE